MFVKEIKKRNKKDGKEFFVHRLVVSERTPQGPRHRVILQLGHLDLPKSQWKALADRIEAIVQGKTTDGTTGELFESVLDPKVEALAVHYANLLIEKRIMEGGQAFEPAREKGNEDVKTGEERGETKETGRSLEVVDVDSIQTSNVRQVGAETISLHGFNQLKLKDILKDAGFNEKEVTLATLAIIGRMVHPGSDLSTVGWAREISALDELLGTSFRHLGKNALYGISEKLYENRKVIDKALREREGRLFSLDRKIILYDLTNTFFEGTGRDSELAKYGRSKEKRTDCPLVTLGMVIDGQGFPLGSEVFKGNQGEPETLKEMVGRLDEEAAPAGEGGDKPVVIMDAGIASEDNLNMLREAGYDYLVVSRKRYDDQVDRDSMIEITVGPDVVIKASLIEQENEQILYCESDLRRKKEQSIKSRLQQHFEEGLQQIRAALGKKGGTKKYDKVVLRVGRLTERYKRIAHFYNIDVIPGDKDKAADIKWEVDTAALEERFGGKYFLRTSNMDLSPEQIRSLYTTLTNVEDSFRAMKSDLGLRPVYHSKDAGIKAHLYITVLAYHVMQTIRHQLRQQGIHIRWSALRERMSTHVRVTTAFTNGQGRRIFVRNTSVPNLFATTIYQALRCNPTYLKNIKYYD